MNTRTLRVGDQLDIGHVRLTVLSATDDDVVLGVGPPVEGEDRESPSRQAVLNAALALTPGEN